MESEFLAQESKVVSVAGSPYEPFREKTNIVDLHQPKHATQANPDWHFSPPVDFLFQESILYI